MSIHKIFPTALLIVTFIYLMMCPAISRMLQGDIGQSVAIRLDKDSSDRQIKRCFAYNPPGLPAAARAEFNFQPGGRLSLVPIAALQLYPVLLCLSTTRLIL